MKQSRWGWLVWPVVVAVIVGGAGLAVATWAASLSLGDRAMEAGRPFAAERHYSRAVSFPVESWKAPFNRGVARYAQEKWDAAADDFELAALRAPVEEDCMIRLNWSTALERAADQLREHDDLDGATARYQSALIVLGTAACHDDQQTADGQSMLDQQSQSQQRLAGKAGQRSENPPDEPPSEEQSPKEQLDERTQQAQQERQLAEERSDPRSGGEGERTW